MRSTRIHEDPRVTKPYTEAQWQRDRRARRGRSTASSRTTTCGSRRAASRRSCRSTTWKARSGTTPRIRRSKRELGRSAAATARAALRARRLAALRAGQVVSGRAAAALGARACTGARTASRCGAIRRAHRRHDQRRATRRSTTRRAFIEALAARLRLAASTRDHRVRGRAEAAARRGGAAGQRRSAAGRSREARRARAPRAPAAARGSIEPAGFVLPLQRGAGDGGQRRSRLAVEPVAAAARAALRDRRRFAARACACRSARCPSVLPEEDEHESAGRSVRAARRRCRRATRSARGRGDAPRRQRRAR